MSSGCYKKLNVPDPSHAGIIDQDGPMLSVAARFFQSLSLVQFFHLKDSEKLPISNAFRNHSIMSDYYCELHRMVGSFNNIDVDGLNNFEERTLRILKIKIADFQYRFFQK